MVRSEGATVRSEGVTVGSDGPRVSDRCARTAISLLQKLDPFELDQTTFRAITGRCELCTYHRHVCGSSLRRL